MLLSGVTRPSTASRFWKDVSGNIAMLTALIMIPLVGVGGLAIDHMQADSAKVRLDTAADAAALAAVNTANAVSTGSVTWGSGDPIAAGRGAAERIFRANAKNVGGAAIPAPEIVLSLVSGEYVATVIWSTVTPATFGRLFGIESHPVAGRAEARSGATIYSDFYIVMDLSASMLIGASDSDIQRTFNLVGCSFACHERENTLPSVRAAGIRLRIDVMKDAIVAAIEELRARSNAPNQYRFGVYGFSGQNRVFMDINDASSSDYDAVIRAVRSADPWVGNGGGSYLSTVMTWIDTLVKPAGDGSMTRPNQRIVLMTDGVQNERFVEANGVDSSRPLPLVGPWRMLGNGRISGIDPSACEQLKRRGVEISTVHVKYTNPVTAGVRDYNAPLQDDFTFIDNVLVPAMPTSLGACASSPANYAHAENTNELYAMIRAAFTSKRVPTLTR
ncbi:MAG: VWA domain-containing protein [Beijerinckiaceae bacterium]|nr:VWA domain-containing protein [Beijerinckiaceae bacterium]